ncbi:branched-chain-amino-acid transaminase [candidate division WOR-1 bacterium RIFOXYC2_FULL_37_10]|uniref:Branched-chain-amino-acid aminotransferase n=1 Tax=candidate division WOR-1 bacterium RIFOXYB2_FULL_37_13 TaxID=1802579 RepID=A0A1F4SLZ4_UNCSA|nr:MAG: branched-chain-amino-acid transaminase [candidate division WOR-1 bacterium RIFOXYB2_FULL_37_13]OGC36481.1 MAG: branched-chain-amino-acid transaminase [candidate division WOR-1 bacterium RIFOXYC2_FULL_37_10]
MKYAFFKGKIVPFSDAKIGIMTHAFNYGTGVFEGIRGYWNSEKKQIFILKLREHYERFQRSTNLALKTDLKYSFEELESFTLELARKNDYKEDIYIRPIYYKSQEKIGLGLIGIDDDFCMYVAPFGAYLDVAKGIKVCVSRWWRISAQSIPQGAKITGTYINSSLAKAEALEKGYDEAILLSHEKTVAEGSGENLFLIKDGRLITPPLSETILPGITRMCVMELARNELGLETIERQVQQKELYEADELFFCGTGAQISPIISVDDKNIKDGRVGLITKKLQDIYFEIAKGDNPKYSDWLTPVY